MIRNEMAPLVDTKLRFFTLSDTHVALRRKQVCDVCLEKMYCRPCSLCRKPTCPDHLRPDGLCFHCWSPTAEEAA